MPDQVGVKVSSQSVNTGEETEMVLDTSVFNPDGMWDAGATDRITAQTSGWHLVMGWIRETNETATFRNHRVSLRRFSSADVELDICRSSHASTNTSEHPVSWLVYLDAGDYITLSFFHELGSAVTVAGANTNLTAAFVAFDNHVTRVVQTAPQAIASGAGTTLEWDDAPTDGLGIFNPAQADRVTIATAGVYAVVGRSRATVSVAGITHQHSLRAFDSGDTLKYEAPDTMRIGSTDAIRNSIGIWQLEAGDYLIVHLNPESNATATTDPDETEMEVVKLTGSATILAETGATTLNDATPTQISWDTEVRDDLAGFDAGTPTRITFPATGIYLIAGSGSDTSGADNGQELMGWKRIFNASAVEQFYLGTSRYGVMNDPSGTNEPGAASAMLASVTAGWWVDAVCYKDMPGAAAASSTRPKAVNLAVVSLTTPVIPTDPFFDDFTGNNGDPWDETLWDQDTGSGGGSTTIQGNRGQAAGSNGNANSGGRGKGNQGQVPNQEMTGTFQLCEVDEPCRGSLWLQTSDDWEGLDNPTEGYGVYLPSDSDVASLLLASSGIVTTLDTADWLRDTGLKQFRFRRQQTKVRFRIWDDGDAEPEGWLLSADDSTITPDVAGAFQIAYTCPTAPSVDACALYDDIAVDENDDPIPDDGGGNRIGGIGAIRKPPRLVRR